MTFNCNGFRNIDWNNTRFLQIIVQCLFSVIKEEARNTKTFPATHKQNEQNKPKPRLVYSCKLNLVKQPLEMPYGHTKPTETNYSEDAQNSDIHEPQKKSVI